MTTELYKSKYSPCLAHFLEHHESALSRRRREMFSPWEVISKFPNARAQTEGDRQTTNVHSSQMFASRRKAANDLGLVPRDLTLTTNK